MEKNNITLYKTVVYICAAITVAWILAEFISLYKPNNNNDRIKIIEEPTNGTRENRVDGEPKHGGETMEQEGGQDSFVPGLDSLRPKPGLQDGTMPHMVKPPKYLQASIACR